MPVPRCSTLGLAHKQQGAPRILLCLAYATHAADTPVTVALRRRSPGRGIPGHAGALSRLVRSAGRAFEGRQSGKPRRNTVHTRTSGPGMDRRDSEVRESARPPGANSALRRYRASLDWDFGTAVRLAGRPRPAGIQLGPQRGSSRFSMRRNTSFVPGYSCAWSQDGLQDHQVGLGLRPAGSRG